MPFINLNCEISVFCTYYIEYAVFKWFRQQGESHFKNIFFTILLYLFYTSFKDFLSFVYQYNLIANFFYLLHPVSAENDRSAFLGQYKNFIFYKVTVYRVKATEWFVENKQLWFM